jgi:hypothetical protein
MNSVIDLRSCTSVNCALWQQKFTTVEPCTLSLVQHKFQASACVVAVEQNAFFVYLSPYSAKVEDTAVLPLSSNKFGGGTLPRNDMDGGLPARRKCACRSLIPV